MKKRLLSMVLAVIMLMSLIPMSVFAATKSVDDYFDGLPIAADPGTGTTAWKVGTKDGQEVLLSGSAGKSYSTSTLTLTFTEDSHLSFAYKVSSEARYDKCTIKLGSTILVDGESGEQDWKGLEVDAKKGDKLTVEYKKDSSGDQNDDCVYLRGFSAGEALVVTFHANNGTEDTATQKIFGGQGTLMANPFTCAGKIFAGWAAAPDGAVQYEDGAAITLDKALDLYAVWADAYTVTLKNGQDVYATILVPQNTAIGSRLPADPAKKGYTFGGWFSGEEKLTAETVISGDVTYTANWSPITYTIAFSGGEGGQGDMDSIPATYDQEVALPKNTFTRPGYGFNGWSTSSGISSGSYADEATVKNLTTKQGETVTLYAAWRGLPVKVTLHLNYDGAEDITRTGVVGSNYNYILDADGRVKFSTVEDPQRTGYIFDGWYDAAEGGNEIALSYKLTAEDAENGFHMYAHWTKGITVHFDGNGYKQSLADKTVTPDKVYSSLPYLSKSYYPDNKALDGWYVKNEDGSFGEAVTKDTVFTGDQVTLIAKWRDYQYIIKYNVKYSDKSTTTGTMADQTAPFGQDVTLTRCGFSREGYVFAGWAESSYDTEVKYLDGAVINRPFEEGDYWDDGSEDGETYSLYAIWTENKSPEQKEAEEKLAAAEEAISGTYNPKYGTDTNALTMIRAKLTAAGITDITVAMKEAAYSSWNYVGIAADGTIQYKWNEKGSTPAASGTVRPTLVLTYKDTAYTKDSDQCLFNIPLDEEKAMAALNTVADRITPPETVESASDLTSLPKYPLKAGVDEGTVDYNDGGSQELWTTASWTSSNRAILSVTESNSAIFAPYKATVTMPRNDTTVTLTLKLVYNGREDLTVTKVYTILFKGTDSPRPVDYQALLETTLRETGLTNPRNGAAINTGSVTSDIQFPTTTDFRTYAARDYHQDFDGKYTPILLCTSDENVVVSADPAMVNVARMLTYQPLPGQGARTVTVTVKILDRPSGSGRDYGSMPVLASKDIVLTVQPMQQSDLDAAFAFMKKVCTEDVYWEGIRSANTDRGNITGDMQSFIEIVPDGDGYRFIRNMNDYNMCGVKADDIPGWYAAQKYRCFRSSNSSVVAHETLLVTQPQYNTRVTIDSVLTYTEYAKYYEKFRNDPAYAEFARFYQQPISTTVTVAGRDGEDPGLLPFDVTLNVEGSSIEPAFQNLTGASYRCARTDNRTAADVLFALLSQNKYDYQGSGYYVTGITDPNGVTLSSGDKRFGSWSGWLFTVNGEMPILRYENGEPIYATLDSYYVKKDDVIRLYYVACPTADGHHTWDDGEVTKAAACTEDGEMTYTCTMCGDQKTEIIPATGHAWGQPAWTWNGTESAAATFICTNDSSHVEVENAVITNEITTSATCTTDGVRTYTAAVTFEQKTYTAVKTEVIPAAGHDTQVVGAVAATCTQDGYTGDEVCKTCGEIVKKGETIPATGHDTQVVGAVDATCTQDGYTGDEVCKTCGVTVKKGETIPATGHDTQLVGAKPATCTQDGYTGDEVCKTCGETVKKGETIPAAGHDTQVVGAKSATCTQDGYTGDEVCKTCGITVKQGEVLPALGHDYKDGKCSRCGAEEPTTPVEPGKPGDSGKPTTPEKPDEPSQPTTPATGDSSTLVLWVSGMLVCALGAGLMLRRKKEN